mmetsp:Transcript_50148/g.100059  ORF Transcript_50148/g.100059 Transcript_50148/m.100059 type:complete len:115 (-) Transcript_50148:33-377(-)
MQSVENKVKDREFVWVDIEASQLVPIKDIDLMRVLERRNQGALQDVPPWLSKGLANVKVPVTWLLRVRIPAGVKSGKKVSFTVHGEKVKAVYKGAPTTQESYGVFALLARAATI